MKIAGARIWMESFCRIVFSYFTLLQWALQMLAMFPNPALYIFSTYCLWSQLLKGHTAKQAKLYWLLWNVGTDRINTSVVKGRSECSRRYEGTWVGWWKAVPIGSKIFIQGDHGGPDGLQVDTSTRRFLWRFLRIWVHSLSVCTFGKHALQADAGSKNKNKLNILSLFMDFGWSEYNSKLQTVKCSRDRQWQPEIVLTRKLKMTMTLNFVDKAVSAHIWSCRRSVILVKNSEYNEYGLNVSP